MKKPFPLPALLFILIGSTFSYAQTISGTVQDSATGAPISFVNIGIVGTDIGSVSNKDGKFQLNISNASHNDTLRFSYIGLHTYNIDVQTIRSSGLNSPVLMREKVFEMKEVVVQPNTLTSKTIGVRKRDGYPIPLFRRAKTEIPFPQKNYRHEIGTLFSGYEFVYLDKVQLNFSEYDVDTLEIRLNIYSLQDGIFENILKEPLYILITDLDKDASPILNLTPLNLFLEGDFLIGIENYKGIPDNSVRLFANLKSKGRAFPTYYRSNSQSSWTNLKVKGNDFGLSIQAYIRY